MTHIQPPSVTLIFWLLLRSFNDYKLNNQFSLKEKTRISSFVIFCLFCVQVIYEG